MTWDELSKLDTGKKTEKVMDSWDDDTAGSSVAAVAVAPRLSYAMNMDLLNAKKRMPFFFEQLHGNNDFQWHDETHGFHGQHCGCRK